MTAFPIRQGLSRRQTFGLFAGLLAAAKAGPALAQGSAAPAVVMSAKVGTGLYEIVFSRTTGLVHVAAAGTRGNSESAGILALDPKTLAVRGTIDLSDEPAFGLGLNDRTGILYTTNTRSGSVSAIDLKTGKTLAKMAKGEKAHMRQVVADEEKNRAFVSVPGLRGAPSAVWVIDGAKQEIVQVIEEGLGEGVSALTLDAANNRLFGASLVTNEVVEIGLADGKVARRFPAGGESSINIAYQPQGNRLFVTNQKSGTLTVLDAASGSLVKSIETGAGALGVTLAPNGTVYVTNRGAGTVSLVDGAKLEVIASLATGTHPNTVAIDRETGTAYVSNKARMSPRGQPPVEDPNGDTVSIIRA